jgi:hypothetical protein
MKYLKTILGFIGGLVFLWFFFWAYILIIETGTLVAVLIVPFVIALMPFFLLCQVIFGDKKVTLPEWIFFIIFSPLFAFVCYSAIKLISEEGV